MSKVKVGWIGLGAMGSGMAQSLASQGFPVKAFDVYPPSVEAAVKAGVVAAPTPLEASKDVEVLALMVVNAAQVEELLFVQGIAKVLQNGASIICFSTVPPSFLISVQKRLDALGTGIGVCDSPVSGGSTRAAEGQLTVMTSGTPSAIKTARPVLDGLTRQPAGRLSVVGDVVGAASDFKLINQVFCAVQIALASESMALAAKLGLNPRMLYNVVRGASGNSFMFGHRVPWQLRYDGIPKSAMTIVTKDIGIVMDEARMMGFPAPLCTAAEQLFTCAIGTGMGREDDGLLIKWYNQFGGVEFKEAGTEEEELERAKELQVHPAEPPKGVLFVGLGAMGLPMAASLVEAGLSVIGADVKAEAIEAFERAGGRVTSDIKKEAPSVDVVVLMPNTALQAEEILLGSDGQGGIASALPESATVILCSTIAPSAAVRLQKLLDTLGRQIKLVDAPVAGGPSRAKTGDLVVMASGETSALHKAAPVLSALSTRAGNTSNLHYIPGGVGSGEKVKAVNNLLAGVQLAVAGEAFAFAKKKGMDLAKVFDVVSSGAAYSYVMVDRWPRMQMANAPVHSATETFVKDLGIVLAEAKAAGLPLWLTTAAQQQFLAACAKGWSREDDSCIARLWEDIGVRVRATA